MHSGKTTFSRKILRFHEGGWRWFACADPGSKKMGTIEVNLLFLPLDAGLSFIGCVKCCCKGILFVSFLEMYPKLF
jgi:hypothetical protein